MLSKIHIPDNYDYVGIFLTDRCHLNCSYCITNHHNSNWIKNSPGHLPAKKWIEGLNRLKLPAGIPLSFQGGEPFLFKGIWDILENVNNKVDIMTALPPFLKREHFEKLKTLEWNKRESPYPTIRVSYHNEEHDFKELIRRIADLNDLLSIGLYYLEHPSNTEEEINNIKEYADTYNVELRSKEFLGTYNGQVYGTYLYNDACDGIRKPYTVKCKNTVASIAPDGNIYKCHSDLYFKRKELALGNILDEEFEFPKDYIDCNNYGLCSECDVKVKTNHLQQYGYTSVDIKKLATESTEGWKKII